jgi:uncharacterized protein YbjT (DUF2867 family)
MKFKKVAVFGASGRQGQAQVWELLQNGYAVRAITRSRDVFSTPPFSGVEIMAADMLDPPSVLFACTGVDAVFCQPPSQKNQDRCLSVADAADRAGVRRVVFNTTQYAPAPGVHCGSPSHDFSLTLENYFSSKRFDLVSFRPTIFMENLLTNFHKPALVREGVYRYCHKADLRGDWICHRDLARYMIAALEHDELVGKRLSIGGPETLSTTEVIGVLSEAMARTLRLEYLTPRQLAPYIFGIVEPDIPLGVFTDFFEGYYDYIHDSPQQPFQIQRAMTMDGILVERTSLRQWAAEQDWSAPSALRQVGSTSG